MWPSSNLSGWVLTIAIVMASCLACTVPGSGSRTSSSSGSSTPAVTVTNPAANDTLMLGSKVQVQSTSIDAVGIARVELLIDGQVIWSDANPQPHPNTPYLVAQPWTPATSGTHVVQVRAYNSNNQVGQSDPFIVDVTAAVQTPSPLPSIDIPTSTPTQLVVIESTSSAPTPIAATAGPTAGATAAASPTTIQTPTATPTPGTFKPTGFEPDGRFRDIWLELGAGRSRLGYPTGPAPDDQNYARQYFERGLMYWSANPDGPDHIWVIDSPIAELQGGTSWNRYVDRWEGTNLYSCPEASANGDKGPIRGFGKLWCDRPELQARLGNPIDLEVGSGGVPPHGQVQFFQGGVMLLDALSKEVFVLFDQGDWLRLQH